MKNVHEIDREIECLKKELETLEGTATEVYTRIVGYYRSVRNWNKGKREEYNYRVPFALPREDRSRPMEAQVQKELFGSENREAEPAEAVRYLYFFRENCPNCPPVAAALEETSFEGEAVDVDTPQGMDEAVRRGILSSPTVVFLNSRDEEILRTGSAREIRTYAGQAETLREPVGNRN